MAHQQRRIRDLQNEATQHAFAHVFIVQHPRSADLAEVPRERVAVVGTFRQTQARSQQAGNDIIDLNVEVLRVNGEL